METTEAQASASLFKKLATVMGQMERLRKTGRNAFHGYEFATDADVSDEVRSKLAEQNVAFFAALTGYTQEPVTIKTKNGERSAIRTLADFHFTFADGDTGAVMTMPWSGEALDNEDKGLNKAATAAEKYFLLKTFLLSTGDVKDDPDSGMRDRRSATSNSRPPQSQGSGSKTAPAPAQTQQPRNVVQMGNTHGPIGRDEPAEARDWKFVFAEVRHFYSEEDDDKAKGHWWNGTVKKLIKDGKVTDAMSDAQVIAEITKYKQQQADAQFAQV